MLCAGSIVDEINSFDARNAIVVFLSSDGKRHQSIFDADGSLTYTVTQREVGYGEADLSVPLEMAAIGPDVPWELWTIGMVNPHVPVLKKSDEIPGHTRLGLGFCGRTPRASKRQCETEPTGKASTSGSEAWSSGVRNFEWCSPL